MRFHPKSLIRSYATLAPMPPQSPVLPRINVFGDPLVPVPTNGGPTTGFFRNNFCDATPLDPASHTVAACLTPAFLTFSASRGNDLRPLFPSSGPLSPCPPSPSVPLLASPTKWAICAARWQEAFEAVTDQGSEWGEEIVPRVVLEATHREALRFARIEDLERFAVGGSGEVGAGSGEGSEGESESEESGGEKIGQRVGR